MISDYRRDLLNIINQNRDSNPSNHVEEIKLLLQEYARRILLYGQCLTDLDLHPTNRLFYDLITLLESLAIDTHIVNIDSGLNNNDFNFADKLLIKAYYNYVMNSADSSYACLGMYSNPYTPYIEILRRGGKMIKYQHRVIEVFPFISVPIPSLEHFDLTTTYWDEDRID